MGPSGTVRVGVSVMSTVVTPIFFRERSSVTDTEREIVGRVGTCEPEMERWKFSLFFFFLTKKIWVFHTVPINLTN